MSSGWSSNRADTVGSAPTKTSPVEPSTLIQSPSPKLSPLSVLCAVFVAYSTTSSAHPATQGLPIWRATTAACDVAPPRAVRIPCATAMPWKSSGEVSTRTRTTFSPRATHSTATSALKTARPTAAPGDAFRP